MINLNIYKYPSTSFLNEVISSKKRASNEIPPYYKDRIWSLTPQLHNFYMLYDRYFEDKILNTICSSESINSEQKKDLLKLYTYRSAPFVKLKNTITTLPSGREINTCQYCTINSVNTLDHIAPKDSFPEFSVHPKNLIPVCSECNSYKSSKWLRNGEFEFLNLYFHILPMQQFLFVNIKYINSTFAVNFSLDNSNDIDPTLFNIISNHYSNLNLIQRFERKSNEVISEFANSILGVLTKLSLDEALECIKKTVLLQKESLGFNHYETILKMELCEGDAFKQYCQKMGYV